MHGPAELVAHPVAESGKVELPHLPVRGLIRHRGSKPWRRWRRWIGSELMIEACVGQHRMIVDADVDAGIGMGRPAGSALAVLGMCGRHGDDAQHAEQAVEHQASYARA